MALLILELSRFEMGACNPFYSLVALLLCRSSNGHRLSILNVLRDYISHLPEREGIEINFKSTTETTLPPVVLQRILHVALFTGFIVARAPLPLSLLQSYHQQQVRDYEKKREEKLKTLKRKKIKRREKLRKRLRKEEDEENDDDDENRVIDENEADEKEGNDDLDEDAEDDLVYGELSDYSSSTPSAVQLFLQVLFYYFLLC
jgi:hypothetical protein